MIDDEPLIFISYTTADRDRVVEIVDHVRSKGLNVWMDFRQLKPGQNWDFEIRRALDRAAIIVAFISKNSVTKTGYVQREIKLALDKAEEKLVDDIYLIPVLLDDDVSIPPQLKGVQFIRFADDNFHERLNDAIVHQLEKTGVATEFTQQDTEIGWSSSRYREFRDGIPGFEAELRLFRFSSDVYPYISQVGDIVKAELLREVMDLRRQLFVASPDFFNFGQPRYRRTHTVDAQTTGPRLTGRMLSIEYAIHTYFAGAAHPNHHFRTFNFLIDPLFEIGGLEFILHPQNEALVAIQAHARRELLNLKFGEEDHYSLDEDQVISGTNEWSDFKAFTFGEHGIEISFAPYQVAAYAFGSHVVTVPYSIVAGFLSPEFKSALDIEYMRFDDKEPLAEKETADTRS